MINLLIDWESYYSKIDQISIVNQGLYNYVRDSYGYIFSVVDMDNPNGFQFCGTIEQFAELDLPFDPASDEVFPWAVNSNFDQGWWDRYFEPFKNEWQCVSDLGTHHQLPRDLARLSHAVTGERSIDKKARDEMDGVHWNSLDLEGKTKMIRYCLTDSIISAKTKNNLPPMTPFEARVAAHTRYINRRGIMIDVDLLEADIDRLNVARHEAWLQIPWSQEINPRDKKPKKPLSMAWLHRWCAMNEIPAPESRAKGSVELDDLMTDHPRLGEVIGYMRAFVKANTLLEKAKAVQMRVDDRGMMPLELLYCGAPHTRRYSSKGVNVQNLDMFPIPFGEAEEMALEAAKEQYGDQCWRHFTTTEIVPVPDGGIDDFTTVTRPGGVWSRRWLIPRPGKKFLILDYAQIEPRCLAWLVGDTAMLNYARSGMSLYEAHARATMGWTGGNLKKENPKLYKLAKARVLGLGYGCGKLKFVTVAKNMANLDVTPEEAATNVQDYRRSNPLVTKFWEQLDECLMAAVREPGDHHLDLTMPSGENMRHWYIRAQYYTDPETKKKEFVGWMSRTVKNDASSASYRLWGGKVCENCLTGDTRILTPDGYILLKDLRADQLVWDGQEFVNHAGVISKGKQKIIDCHGVRSTLDHLFRTVDGNWIKAEEACYLPFREVSYPDGVYTKTGVRTAAGKSIGLGGRKVWNTDGSSVCRSVEKKTTLGMSMSVRKINIRPINRTERKAILLQSVPAVQSTYQGRKYGSWNVQTPGICRVEKSQTAVRKSKAPSLQKLWWTWHSSVCQVGQKFRKFLAGHGADVSIRTGHRARKQRRQLRAGKLCLGNSHCQLPNPTNRNDAYVGVGAFRHGRNQAEHSILSSQSGNESRRCSYPAREEVFDILDCGPRHRFAVFPAETDRYLVAHNCTQRMARDVMVDGTLRLVDAGFEVMFSCHDELILEVDIDAGEEVQEQASAILRTPPGWAWDLPLDVEGGYAEHYIK